MRREPILDTGVAETDNQLHAFTLRTLSNKPKRPVNLERFDRPHQNYFFFASLASAAGAAAAGAAPSVLPFFATSGSVGATTTSSTGAISSLITVTWATV